MINSFTILKGNIGKMECQYTPQGKFIAKGSIAVNIGYGEKRETNWYNFIAWEATGELLNKFCEVGTTILIMGRQKFNKWTDKEGVEHMSVDVTISDFEVLKKGKAKEEHTEDEPEYLQGD